MHSYIWNETDSFLSNFVSINRQKKIQQYVYDIDRKLSLYAGLLVRMSISQLTNTTPNNLVFGFRERYKPCLLSYPTLEFNLSHTRNAILCCVSSKSMVGCDIEQIVDPPFEIMKDVFHYDEIKYIYSSPYSDAAITFFKIWTRKEAYLKQTGIGLDSNLYSYNTLSPNLSSLLFTWQSDSYICSVCGNDLNDLNEHIFKQVSESDIINFFQMIDYYKFSRNIVPQKHT